MGDHVYDVLMEACNGRVVGLVTVALHAAVGDFMHWLGISLVVLGGEGGCKMCVVPCLLSAHAAWATKGSPWGKS